MSNTAQASCQKPTNYVGRVKNSRRRDDFLCFQGFQPSTYISLMMSQQTAESPVLIMSLITKWQILVTHSLKFSPIQPLFATKSATKRLYQ